MRKSEFIQKIAMKQESLSYDDVVLCIENILTYLAKSLSQKGRIEIRDFGNLSLRHQAPREAHDPKKKRKISVPGKYKVHFKMGKGLKEQLNKVQDV